MVFSSVPIYLDPPNWQQLQQANHQQQQGSSFETPQIPPLPQAPHAGTGTGSIRPGFMADRARLAKIPVPEAALKCPRCESTNTKFCYFNNYSLSQPRHFCKTCRRYWTRGGALRNVPVGGGCRRNKKSKTSSNSKSSSVSSGTETQIGGPSFSTNCGVSSETSIGILGQQMSQLPYLGSLQGLSQFGMGNIGLNVSGFQGQTSSEADFQMGNSFAVGVQQFPFFETTTGLFPFQNEGVEGQPSVMVGGAPSSRVSELASVKVEENQRRPFPGASENNQFWGGNAWTNLSGLNSSSSANHLL